ncbi:MAG TPA: hypothetical protein DDW65_01150 [Firmicutes bacterium]|nr:hypothetical protein [Bacillota bacterium]
MLYPAAGRHPIFPFPQPIIRKVICLYDNQFMVRSSRFTHELIKKSDGFTVSIPSHADPLFIYLLFAKIR